LSARAFKTENLPGTNQATVQDRAKAFSSLRQPVAPHEPYYNKIRGAGKGIGETGREEKSRNIS